MVGVCSKVAILWPYWGAIRPLFILISLKMKHNKPRLPRCVAKSELKHYFDCSFYVLWKYVIPRETLVGWGVNLSDFQKWRVLPPDVTRKIYEMYGISDLDAHLSDEIASKASKAAKSS